MSNTLNTVGELTATLGTTVNDAMSFFDTLQQ